MSGAATAMQVEALAQCLQQTGDAAGCLRASQPHVIGHKYGPRQWWPVYDRPPINMADLETARRLGVPPVVGGPCPPDLHIGRYGQGYSCVGGLGQNLPSLVVTDVTGAPVLTARAARRAWKYLYGAPTECGAMSGGGRYLVEQCQVGYGHGFKGRTAASVANDWLSQGRVVIVSLDAAVEDDDPCLEDCVAPVLMFSHDANDPALREQSTYGWSWCCGGAAKLPPESAIPPASAAEVIEGSALRWAIPVAGITAAAVIAWHFLR